MILDERVELADATALNTGGAGAYVLGDVVDLGAAGRDIGDGEDVFFCIQVTTLFASATGSVRFDLVSSAAAALTSPTVHVASATYAAAFPAVGTLLLAVSLPRGVAYLRFLGVLQNTITAALTAGAVNAFITHDVARFRAYVDAV